MTARHDVLSDRPGDIIGYRKDGRPIRLIGGGSGEGDGDSGKGGEGDTDDSDDDDDDDEDEDANPPPPPDPKALAEENARLKKALAKSNRDAARNRRKAAGKDDDGTDDEDSPAALKRQLQERDAADALRDGGIQGTPAQVRGYVKLLSSVHPDDLEDAVEELKEKFPNLFEAPKSDAPRTPPARTRDRSSGGDDGKPKAGLSRTSRLMLRQGRGA